MGARNSTTSYGWVARLLHWVIALVVLGMFGLGLWMRGLDYYDPWYQPAPELHISIGLALIGLMIVRMLWRFSNPTPEHVGTSMLENRLAGLAHFALYALLIALMATGYIYATAEGRPADMFGILQAPAIPGAKAFKGTVGWVHEYLSYGIIALATLHALAALKHHFVDRDVTLVRMITGKPASTITSSMPPKNETETNT